MKRGVINEKNEKSIKSFPVLYAVDVIGYDQYICRRDRTATCQISEIPSLIPLLRNIWPQPAGRRAGRSFRWASPPA